MKVKAISLPYIFQVMYVLCFTRPRYQVSVYRTIGPLVFLWNFPSLRAFLIIAVMFLNFWTAKNFAVIYLKFKQKSQTIEYFVEIANSEEPDPTAPQGAVWSSLIWVCTICLDLSVRKLRIITVSDTLACF